MSTNLLNAARKALAEVWDGETLGLRDALSCATIRDVLTPAIAAEEAAPIIPTSDLLAACQKAHAYLAKIACIRHLPPWREWEETQQALFAALAQAEAAQPQGDQP